METEKIEIQKRMEDIAQRLVNGKRPGHFVEEVMAKWSISERTFYRNVGDVRKAINAGKEYYPKYLANIINREEAAAAVENKFKSRLEIKALLHSIIDGTYKEEKLMYTKGGVTKMECKPATPIVLKVINKVLAMERSEKHLNEKL
jgi:hypothetical protein